MGAKEQIHALLPDNSTRQISEKDLRDAFDIALDNNGAIIDEDDTFYKEKEEDGWRSVSIDVPVHILSYVSDLRSSFYIYENLVGGVIGGVRNGMINRLVSPFWEGKEFWIYNATGADLELNSENVTEIDVYSFVESAILKDKQSCKVKLRRDTLEIVGVSGGASFPEVGNDGDVLLKSGTNAVWSSIIKGVEFLGNSWLKLKIITFQGYTIAQKNAIASPTEGMFIYQNENPKGFQKYENGAWTPLGNNISNADLTTVSARTFTQGNTFTWNTGGFGYFWKGLVDKTGIGTYTKVVVVHSTTGEVVTREISDLKSRTISSTFNPPNTSQLISLGLTVGDYYKHIASGQISLFNGSQLEDWVLNSSQYTALTQSQRDAIKVFNIYL